MENDELKLLENQAAQADKIARDNAGGGAPEAGGPLEGEPEGPGLDAAKKEAEAIAEMLAEGVETLFPALGFLPETRQTFANKLAPVMAKYNFSVGFGRWKEEMELGMFTAGLVIGCIKVVRGAKQAVEVPTDTVQPDGGK